MSEQPVISIIHPTARVRPYPSFPRGWRGACEQFFATCDHPQRVEYVLIVHESRWEEFLLDALNHSAQDRQSAAAINAPQSSIVIPFVPWGTDRGQEPIQNASIKLVRNTGRDCVVDQINAGAAASTGELLLGIMDDLEAPEHWDTKLLALIDDAGVDGYCPEAVIDLTGEPTEWIVYSALTRKRYEKLGYILHPEFESMYADNHYSKMAHLDGVVISGRHLGFRHNHPMFNRGELDEVYQGQNHPAKYFHGRNTLARLMGDPVQKAIAVCLPGEWYQASWTAAWTQLFGHLIGQRGMMVLPFFGHTTNVYCSRIELSKGVLENPLRVDYVLWIDDDNTLRPDQFDMLLADLEAHPELDGIVAWCWCDNHQHEAHDIEKWTMSVGKQGPNMECWRFTQEDVQQFGGPMISSRELEATGFGFWSGFPVVLMRRSVLETLTEGAFAPVIRDDINYKFSGEDTAFFWRARQAGMNFAVDLRVQVPHVKWRAIEPSGELVQRWVESRQLAGVT